MEEDWDAEIAGAAPITTQLQSISINQNNTSPASKYFDADYHDDHRDSYNGFGSHVSFEGSRGRGRGRGRGFGRGRY